MKSLSPETMMRPIAPGADQIISTPLTTSSVSTAFSLLPDDLSCTTTSMPCRLAASHPRQFFRRTRTHQNSFVYCSSVRERHQQPRKIDAPRRVTGLFACHGVGSNTFQSGRMFLPLYCPELEERLHTLLPPAQ